MLGGLAPHALPDPSSEFLIQQVCRGAESSVSNKFTSDLHADGLGPDSENSLDHVIPYLDHLKAVHLFIRKKVGPCLGHRKTGKIITSTMITKTQTKRSLDQIKAQSPHIYVQLILNKGGKAIRCRNYSFFNKWCWKNIHVQKNKHSFIPCILYKN